MSSHGRVKGTQKRGSGWPSSTKSETVMDQTVARDGRMMFQANRTQHERLQQDEGRRPLVFASVMLGPQ